MTFKFDINIWNLYLLKFRYFEKATKFETIFFFFDVIYFCDLFRKVIFDPFTPIVKCGLISEGIFISQK